MKGLISLVGAGPGDPGLLTLQGLRRIQEADLIVYDTLVNPQHLRHAKKEAISFCVGKDYRHKRLSQEKINHLILRASLKGKRTVRLKGGDPCLFGRGGEEALYFFNRRAPFEIVPGVTSATACAAAAGIPLTHREHNASVTFVTGHRAYDEKKTPVDWDRVASLGGTIVIYMGFYNLSEIAQRLVKGGLSSKTPVAVIEWGTLAYQKTCYGTLDNIAKLVTEKKLGAPCMIVIGDVVRLNKKLNWFEKRPLFGKTIVITRAEDQIGPLTDRLSELGAEVIGFPTIEIQALSDCSRLDRCIENIKAYDWVVFTSAYGVRAYLDRLRTHHKKDSRWLRDVKIASIGSKTSQALGDYGLKPDLQPGRFEVQGLLDEFKKRKSSITGRNILLVRTDIAPPLLDQGLAALGARVERLSAYRTRIPKGPSGKIRNLILGGSVDAVVFTSSSTVTHFIRILGRANVKRIAKKTKLASIGPVTSKTLRSEGFSPSIQARTFTADGIVEALKRRL